MKLSAFLTLAVIFGIMYLANYLLPLFIGDDYLYAFIWTGTPMMEPMPEHAQRVADLWDIVVSQWSLYFTWGGRVLAEALAQFFIWQGKPFFNFCNSLVFILLILEIYWLGDEGYIHLKLKPSRLIWIFFCLWMFVPCFMGTIMWLTGACNYLWMTVLLLIFLLPYVRFGLTGEEPIKPSYVKNMMFPCGILAGWTNENTVCWIILVLLIYMVSQYKKGEPVPLWMKTGFLGLIVGYSLLILAPGNLERAYYEFSLTKDYSVFVRLKNDIIVLFIVLLWQTLLWFPILNAFRREKEFGNGWKIRRRFQMAKLFCIISLASELIMFLTLYFQPRTSFAGTVYLIIAHGLIWQGQEETGVKLMTEKTRRFLWRCGTVALTVSLAASFWGWKKCYDAHETLLEQIQMEQRCPTGNPIFFPGVTYERWIDILGGVHLLNYGASENAGDWKNVAFARYYGIVGIYGTESK